MGLQDLGSIYYIYIQLLKIYYNDHSNDNLFALIF